MKQYNFLLNMPCIINNKWTNKFFSFFSNDAMHNSKIQHTLSVFGDYSHDQPHDKAPKKTSSKNKYTMHQHMLAINLVINVVMWYKKY